MTSFAKRAARLIGGLVPVLAFIVISTPFDADARPTRGGGGGSMRGGGGARAGG
ncbi:hypothetical protein H8B08_18120, partial [Caulobacter sp. 17J80-11]|nr:hypothetical protein [Caulobacter sp. 17J80-11]